MNFQYNKNKEKVPLLLLGFFPLLRCKCSLIESVNQLKFFLQNTVNQSDEKVNTLIPAFLLRQIIHDFEPIIELETKD